MNNFDSEPDTKFVELHRRVQLLLGRCLLQLQQYETLLKKVLPLAAYSGKPDELSLLLANASDFIGSKTMGPLVSMLTENVLRPSHSASEKLGIEALGKVDSIFFSSRTEIVFDEQTYLAIKASLKELVALRNTLVHGFISKFNIWQLDGCMAAEAFLSKSLESINHHLVMLRDWTKAMDEARCAIAAAITDPIFCSFLHDGIGPDGIVQWPISGIVSGLRDAEAELSSNGWTALDSAIAWMGLHAPEHFPKRYGCNSWRQVLHDSRQFDIFKQAPITAPNASKLTVLRVWYRSRRRPFDA